MIRKYLNFLEERKVNFKCVDCKGPTEFFFVKNEIWDIVPKYKKNGQICLNCLEKRLGRKLTENDFQIDRTGDINKSQQWYYKKFNEGIYWGKDRNDLIEFCNYHLAYLKDDGFLVNISIYSSGTSGHIEISKSGSVGFKWDDIKYDFIPFINILIEKYNLDIEPPQKFSPSNIRKLFIEFCHSNIGGYKVFTQEPSNDEEDIDEILFDTLKFPETINKIRIKYR